MRNLITFIFMGISVLFGGQVFADSYDQQVRAEIRNVILDHIHDAFIGNCRYYRIDDIEFNKFHEGHVEKGIEMTVVELSFAIRHQVDDVFYKNVMEAYEFVDENSISARWIEENRREGREVWSQSEIEERKKQELASRDEAAFHTLAWANPRSNDRSEDGVLADCYPGTFTSKARQYLVDIVEEEGPVKFLDKLEEGFVQRFNAKLSVIFTGDGYVVK